MTKKIKKLGEKANKTEVGLRYEVFKLDNYMDECKCDDAVKYSFYNTMSYREPHIFCLNCGGYI